MLLEVAIAALALSQAGDNEAADWECATPLIERNYSQPFDSGDLAARIHDECVRPLVRTTPEGDAYIGLAMTERSIHSANSTLFLQRIEGEILRLRRYDRIELR